MRGRVEEQHSIISIKNPCLSFDEQLRQVHDEIKALSEGLTLRFIRFFISDCSNQQGPLENAFSWVNCPVSIVQQPPLDGTKLAAWCYCTEQTLNPAYQHSLITGLISDKEGSLAQMEDIFDQYATSISKEGQNIADNCVRTWIFVRDVDTNYAGVVKGRKNVFDAIGLTHKTHYIASTGIQGSTADHKNLVLMDAYSIGGLQKGQLNYLYAKSHLSPTYDYGVTFERGAYVDYGDRRHIFISGTASIDHKGEILHVGDVTGQAERMMENIEALLSEANATLNDIKVSIVYLRDTADYSVVSKLFQTNWPNLNPIFVLAPVCRPGWLIEMECIAIKAISAPEFAPFIAL